jgi:hypothetical protein
MSNFLEKKLKTVAMNGLNNPGYFERVLNNLKDQYPDKDFSWYEHSVKLLIKSIENLSG